MTDDIEKPKLGTLHETAEEIAARLDWPLEKAEKFKRMNWLVPGDERRGQGGRKRISKAVKMTLPALCRLHTVEAVETAVDVMRDPEAKPEARLKAAALLMSRGWGLPNQSITVDANLQTNTIATIDATQLSPEARAAILTAYLPTLSSEIVEADFEPLESDDD